MGKKAFTLVELIVVIVIIALLAAAGMASYDRVQKNARDSRRLSDMRDLRNALLLYKSIHGTFPGNVDNDCYGWDTSYDGDFIRDLADPNILPHIPQDPLNTSSSGACDGHESQPGYNYFYYRYSPPNPAWGCEQRTFVVLGVGKMETSSPHKESPGFKCSGRDWEDTLDYVIQMYE